MFNYGDKTDIVKYVTIVCFITRSYKDVRLLINGVQYPRQEGADLGVDARCLLGPDHGAVLTRGYDTHQVHEA